MLVNDTPEYQCSNFDKTLSIGEIIRLTIEDSFKYWKTTQIPSVSVFCNPRTVDLTCTFQEQLIVVEDQFLASRNKNNISQAAHFFHIVKSSTKQYWLFLSRHGIGPYEGPKYIIPEQQEIIDFLLGYSICCPICVTGVPVSLE